MIHRLAIKKVHDVFPFDDFRETQIEFVFGFLNSTSHYAFLQLRLACEECIDYVTGSSMTVPDILSRLRDVDTKTHPDTGRV